MEGREASHIENGAVRILIPLRTHIYSILELHKRQAPAADDSTKPILHSPQTFRPWSLAGRGRFCHRPVPKPSPR